MAKLPRRRPPHLAVRRAGPGDRAALLAMWSALLDDHAALHESYALAPGAREALAAAVDRELRDPRALLYVADTSEPEGEGAAPAGFCVARWVEGASVVREGRRGLLDELWVRPPERRRGVGRRLVAAVLDALVEAGCARVEVRVLAANEGARAFWRAQGFGSYVEVLEWSGQRH